MYPTTTYHFYYNDDGTVQRIFASVEQRSYSSSSYYQAPSYYIYFAYKGNIVQVRTVYGSQTTASSIDTLMLDAQNRVTSVYHSGYNYNPYGWQSESYTYDSLGEMHMHVFSSYSNVSYDSLTWLNGDPVTDSLVVNGGEMDMHYTTYNDSLYSTGNITASMADFEKYGRSITTSKHLTKQLYDSQTDSTWTYNYVLDAGGKITNIAKIDVGGGVNSTQITYNCE